MFIQENVCATKLFPHFQEVDLCLPVGETDDTRGGVRLVVDVLLLLPSLLHAEMLFQSKLMCFVNRKFTTLSSSGMVRLRRFRWSCCCMWLERRIGVSSRGRR